MRDLEANHRDVARLYYQLAGRYCGLLMFNEAMPEGCRVFIQNESKNNGQQPPK